MTRSQSGAHRMRFFKGSTCLSPLILSCVVSLPGYAQETGIPAATSEEPIVLETIVIEALRQSQPTAAVPDAVTIIEEQDLASQLAVTGDISTVLGNQVPGFSPSRQKLSNSGETLRGRSPLYMIDGVPQSNPLRDSSRDGHTIDPDLLERVEVVNGSNAIQGMGALGGIINLQTRDLANSEEWEGFYRLRFSTGDNFERDGMSGKGAFMIGRKYGNFDLTFGLTAAQNGIYYDGNGDIVGLDPNQGDTQDSFARDLFLKAGYDFSDHQRIQLMVNDFDLQGDGDYVPVDGDRSRGLYSTSRRGSWEGDAPKNDVTTVSLEYTDEDLYGGQLRAQFFYQKFAALFGGDKGDSFQDPAIAPFGTLFDQSQNESRKQGLKLSYSHSDLGIDGLSATMGIDLLRDETQQVLVNTGRNWVPKSKFSNWAPFIHLSQNLLADRLTISGGLRYENAKLEVGDFRTIYGAGAAQVAGGSPSFSEVLPDVGAVFRLQDNLSAYMSYSKGFTMPDVGRVLRWIEMPGQDVDSLLNLEPVIADNREIGIEYDNGQAAFKAAYFWSDSDLGERMIERDGTYYSSRQRTEIEGFELSASYQASDALRFGGIYSRTRGQYDSDGNDKVDTDLGGINISPDRLNLFAEWNGDVALSGPRPTPVSGRLQLSHFFDRDFKGNNAPDGRDFDGYTLASLSLSAQTQIGDFSLGIDNLFDKDYATYYSQTVSSTDDRYFAGRGRTLTLTYETRF